MIFSYGQIVSLHSHSTIQAISLKLLLVNHIGGVPKTNVTLENCELASDLSVVRGIKIDDQYAGDGALQNGPTNLTVRNTSFKTGKKAAILVKVNGETNINLEGIDISQVAADKENAVWYDADAVKENKHLIQVDGGTLIDEPK